MDTTETYIERICRPCQHIDMCDKSVIKLCRDGKCPWRFGRGSGKGKRDWASRNHPISYFRTLRLRHSTQ